MHRWYTDGRNVKRSRRRETSLDGLEGRDAELLGSFRQDSGVAVHNCGKLDGFARLLQLPIDAKMVSPEGSCSNDSDA